MRLWLISLLILCHAAVDTTAATDSLVYVDSVPYKLFFSDEFEGTSLDTTKWLTYFPQRYYDDSAARWLQNDQGSGARLFYDYDQSEPSSNQVLQDSNVVVREGKCILYTREQAAQWMGHERGYTSGMLNTREAYLGGGVYELKCRFAPAYLYSYAFWLYGVEVIEGVPVSSEVDIFEFFHREYNSNTRALSKYECNVHKWRDGKIISTAHDQSQIDSRQWHVYRCVWDDFAVRMYIDDMQHPIYTYWRYYDGRSGADLTYTTRDQVAPTHWREHDYFPHAQQYTEIIINAGTTRNKAMKKQDRWTHRKSPSENAMEIDYVRFYKKVDTSKY